MASTYKTQFIETRQKTKTKTKKKIIFSLLEENSMLSPKDLAHLADCTTAMVRKTRCLYFKAHPKPQTNQEIIFSLLNKNPKLSGTELMHLTNLPQTVVYRYKKRWLQQQQAEQGEPPDDESASAD